MNIQVNSPFDMTPGRGTRPTGAPGKVTRPTGVATGTPGRGTRPTETPGKGTRPTGVVVKGPGRCVRPTGAFTLVELMVAMALLAVLITALLMAFQQVQRAFRVGANQSDILENGRAIMALISRDIQEMTYAATTNGFNFYANINPSASVLPVKLPTLTKTADLLLEELFILKRHNDEWRTVKYLLDANQAASGVGTLYYKTTNCSYPEIEGITRWADATEQIGTNGPAFRRIADGVVHFRIQAFDREGRLLTPGLATNSVWMAVAAIPQTTNDFSYAYRYTNLPAFVDIEIGLLESHTLKQLQGRLMGVAPADVNSFCQQYLAQKAGRIHLFRQRIPIRNQHRIDT